MFREMREETHWKETIWEGTAINEVFDPSKQELEHFELFPSHVTDDRKKQRSSSCHSLESLGHPTWNR